MTTNVGPTVDELLDASRRTHVCETCGGDTKMWCGKRHCRRCCAAPQCADRTHDRGMCSAARCGRFGCDETHQLAESCPKCRWIVGDLTPTAYQCSTRPDHWQCAACGLLAVSRQDAFDYHDSWGGRRYPNPERALGLIERITARGWYVPPKAIAVAIGRHARSQEHVEHMTNVFSRMWVDYPGSGLADLVDEEIADLLGVAEQLAGAA